MTYKNRNHAQPVMVRVAMKELEALSERERDGSTIPYLQWNEA